MLEEFIIGELGTYNNPILRKVLRMMIRIVLGDALPADVDDIARPAAVDVLLDDAARAPQTPVDVAHDVRPQRPGALVPRRRRRHVDGRARHGGAPGQCLRGGREVPDVRVADQEGSWLRGLGVRYERLEESLELGVVF